MLLVAVLVIITVLALLGASFSYLMNAQLASVKAGQDQQQAYYTAMTGIDRTIEMLREGRVLQDNWYNNPSVFRRVPLFIPGQREDDIKGGSTSLADQEVIPGMSLWRWSIVATEIPKDDTQRAKIRYGLTDEASKVNINVATRSQLIAIFDLIRHDNVTSTELADALIDWRDTDDDAQTQGAESAYYLTLKPAYRCKNAPLTSVEELLQIKGFTGRIVYGEDYNRNGYLDANENDGEEGAFPPDDGDGKLDRGLLPFVTIYSWDWNRSNDNKNRVDINTVSLASVSSGGDQSGSGQQGNNTQDSGLGALAALANRVPPQVTEEIRPEVIDFIADAQKQGYKFKSIGDLLGLEVYSNGKSNHDPMWKQYAKDYRQAEKRLDDTTAQAQADEADGQDDEENNQDQGGNNQGQGGGGGSKNSDNNQGNDNNNRQPNRNDNNSNSGSSKNDARNMQSIRQNNNNNNNNSNNSSQDQPGGGRGAGRRPNRSDQGSGSSNNNDGSNGQGRGPRPPRNGQNNPGNQNDQNNPPNGPDAGPGGPGNGPPDGDDGNGQGPGRGRGGNRGGRGGNRGDGNNGGNPGNNGGNPGGNPGGNTGGNGGGNNGRTLTSPVEASDLPALCDRLSVWNSPVMSGLINVNTAPVQVLRTIPGLTAEEAESIVEKRQGLQGVDKLTPAWLVTTGAISPETFALISNLVTTRSIQFTIDAIGFNDTVGTVKRVQAVVEMRGELATVKYLRDITSLGIGFPVWDDQRSEGFAFTDR